MCVWRCGRAGHWALASVLHIGKGKASSRLLPLLCIDLWCGSAYSFRCAWAADRSTIVLRTTTHACVWWSLLDLRAYLITYRIALSVAILSLLCELNLLVPAQNCGQCALVSQDPVSDYELEFNT
jgi:hypothetical protein